MKIKRVITIAEPIVIIVIGLVVGIIVVSIILPIFSINEVIG